MLLQEAIDKLKQGKKIEGVKLSTDKQFLVFENGICVSLTGYKDKSISISESDFRKKYSNAVDKWTQQPKYEYGTMLKFLIEELGFQDPEKDTLEVGDLIVNEAKAQNEAN